MRYLKIVFLALIVGFVQACANPSIVNFDQAKMDFIAADTIVFVPRFEGDPNFVEESTDYFISTIEAETTKKVLQGSVMRNESADISDGGNLIPLEVALETAMEKGADVLVMGKVTSYNNGVTLNGFSTIRLYNVQTGERIANFHEPSGLLVAYSEHQSVMAAVKRTAKHTAKLLR